MATRLMRADPHRLLLTTLGLLLTASLQHGTLQAAPQMQGSGRRLWADRPQLQGVDVPCRQLHAEVNTTASFCWRVTGTSGACPLPRYHACSVHQNRVATEACMPL